MVQPINYMAQIPQPNIGANLLSGLQIGAGIQDMQAKRVAAEQAQQAKQKFATDLQAAQADGSQKAWLNMIGMYPQFREAFGDVRKGLGEEQVSNEFNSGFEVSTALENKKPEVAMQRLQLLIDSNKNSGKPTGIYQQAYDLIATGDVTAAQGGINKALSILDPDRFKKTVAAQSTAAKAPSELTQSIANANKAVADAQIAIDTAPNEVARLKAVSDKAIVDADFARAKAELEAKQQAATLRKTEADILIAQEDNRIKALNAAAAKELNAVKRDEILQRREDATDKRDQAKRDQKSLLDGQIGTIDNFLNTAIRATNTPLAVRNDATGPLRSRLPTTSQDVADYEGLIETLGAQAFLSQIPQIKGTGSLSENEGNKLQASLQNLSLKQSPERLQENINEAVRLLTKARANIATRSGMSAPAPDTPAAAEVNVVVNGISYLFPNQAAADAAKKAAGIK